MYHVVSIYVIHFHFSIHDRPEFIPLVPLRLSRSKVQFFCDPHLVTQFDAPQFGGRSPVYQIYR